MQTIQNEQSVTITLTNEEATVIAGLVDMFEEDVPAKEFIGSLFGEELEKTHELLRSVVSSLSKSNES